MERTLTWHSLVLSLVETYHVVAFISARPRIRKTAGGSAGSGKDIAYAVAAVLAGASTVGGAVAWRHVDWLGWVGMVWFGVSLLG